MIVSFSKNCCVVWSWPVSQTPQNLQVGIGYNRIAYPQHRIAYPQTELNLWKVLQCLNPRIAGVLSFGRAVTYMFSGSSGEDPAKVPELSSCKGRKLNIRLQLQCFCLYLQPMLRPLLSRIWQQSIASASPLLPRSTGSYNPIKLNSLHFEFDFAFAFIILNQMGTVSWQALWTHTASRS